MQFAKDLRDLRRPVVIAETQRAMGVTQRQPHRAIQHGGRGDAPLGDLAAEVDDPGQHPLGDEAGGIVDHLHRHTVGAQRLPRLRQQLRVQRRLTHQHAARVEAGEGLQGQGALRRQLAAGDQAAGVLAQGRDQADRLRPRLLAHLQLRPGASQHGRDLVAHRRIAGVEPERPLDHHRSWRFRFFRQRLAIHVGVEPLAGLASQQAAGQPRRHQGRGGIARVLVELAVDRLHHGVGNVQPHQVEQLEGTHGKAQAVLEDAVDLRGRGDALGEDAQGFRPIGPARMVDQEAGGVRGDGSEVPGLLGQGRQALDHLRIGALTAHHLDDLHQGHRVEEVEAGDPLRALAGTGDQADGQR
ncbi:hypothetical protein D3C84_563230 [compost metagenome]